MYSNFQTSKNIDFHVFRAYWNVRLRFWALRTLLLSRLPAAPLSLFSSIFQTHIVSKLILKRPKTINNKCKDWWQLDFPRLPNKSPQNIVSRVAGVINERLSDIHGESMDIHGESISGYDGTRGSETSTGMIYGLHQVNHENHGNLCRDALRAQNLENKTRNFQQISQIVMRPNLRICKP